MVSSESEDRRGQAPDRRRYNRRNVPDSSPPYYEAFERIAVALETLAAQGRQLTLPDAQKQPVRPRGRSEA